MDYGLELQSTTGYPIYSNIYILKNNVKHTQTNVVLSFSCIHCIGQFGLIDFGIYKWKDNFVIFYDIIKNWSKPSPSWLP